MVRSWGRLEVGSAPSFNLVRSWGRTCGRKMGQPGLKTGQVGRWGTTYLYVVRNAHKFCVISCFCI